MFDVYMDAHAIDVMQECTKGSDDERLMFPQIVTKLMEAGVEQYHAEARRGQSCAYDADRAEPPRLRPDPSWVQFDRSQSPARSRDPNAPCPIPAFSGS